VAASARASERRLVHGLVARDALAPLRGASEVASVVTRAARDACVAVRQAHAGVARARVPEARRLPPRVLVAIGARRSEAPVSTRSNPGEAAFCGSAGLGSRAGAGGSPPAGLRAGDQLLQINNRTPQSLIACNRLLGRATNHTASLLISRGQERQTLTVHLVPFDALIRQKLGLTLLEVTSQNAQRLGFQPGQGLFIDAVEKNSPAERAQLQRGYLLAAIEGQKTVQITTVAEVLSNKKKGESAQLSVIVPRRGPNYVEFRQGTVELDLR